MSPGAPRAAAVVAASLLVFSSRAATAQPQSASSAGGCPLTVSHVRFESYDADYTTAARQAVAGTLERVHDVVRSTLAATSLRDLRAHATVATGLDQAMPFVAADGDRSPFTGFYQLAVFGPDFWDAGCGIKKSAGPGSASVLVVANVLGTILEDQKTPIISGADERLYPEPRVTDTVAGLPMYENQAILVTNIRRPPYLPVSVEYYMRTLIATWERDYREASTELERDASTTVAERSAGIDSLGSVMDSVLSGMQQTYEALKAQNPTAAAELAKSIEAMKQSMPETRRNIARVQASRQHAESLDAAVRRTSAAWMDSSAAMIRDAKRYLESLSPAERQADAYTGGGTPNQWGLTPRREGAFRIVRLNPDFFDRSAPRSAIQVLAIMPSKADDPARHELAMHIARKIDVTRLRALLTR